MHTDQQVYAKSALGQAEMARRSLRLPPAARALLIMTDGKTPAGVLRLRLPGGDFAADLRLLEEQGLVTVMPAGHGAPASALAAPAAGRKSVALAKLYLMSVMERALLHQEHPVRDALRSAASREEVLAAFAHCREVLLALSGADYARSIERQLEAVIPGGLPSG